VDDELFTLKMCARASRGCGAFQLVRWLDFKEEVSSIATQVNLYEGYFHAIMARFDQLEQKLESLIDEVIDEVKDGNEPKDLPLNEFFSTFCALKAWKENYPSAKGTSQA